MTLKEVLDRVAQLTDFMFEFVPKAANDRGSSGDYPLHKAAIWGDVVAARVLLENGADINAKGEDDDTPLHRAFMARTNIGEIVKFLLSQGADPDLANRHGDTPRKDAIELANPEILSALRLRDQK